MARPNVLAPYAGPAYLIAALMVGYSAADAVALVWPPVFSDVGWRYGMVGALAGYAITPLLGVLLATVTATSAGHPRVLRTVAAISVLLGVALAVLLLGFGLDAVQVRRTQPVESLGLVDRGIAKVVGKHLGAIWAWIWLGRRAWRFAGQVRPVKSGSTQDGAGLVVRAAD